MRRFARVLAIAVALSGLAIAQEGSEKKEPEHAQEAAKEGHGGSHEPGEGMELWKWANFLLLAGLIGYAIGKNAGPFFDRRSLLITKDMAEAAEARRAAEARAQEAETRLANLQQEVASVRAVLQQESEAEQQRLSRQAADEIAKIQAHAEQEIVSAGKAARSDLKRYSAELALKLAEQKLRARMTPEAEDALVQSFVHGLK